MSLTMRTTKRGRKSEAKLLDSLIPTFPEVAICGDKAVLPQNFLPTLSMDSLPSSYFFAAYKYYPHFDSQVRSDETGRAMDVNEDRVNSWEFFFRTQVFGDEFIKEMRHAFDVLVSSRVKLDNFCGEGGQHPKTWKQVEEMILSPQFFETFIESGKTGEMVGFIFKWIYASTMETADWGWIEDALVEYFEREGMHVTLGPSSGDRCRVHSIKRFTKTVATNSALTAFKEKQMKSWGFSIELHKKLLDDGSFPDARYAWQAHDISDMVDEQTKRKMTRVGGCVFLTRHALPTNPAYLVKCRVNAAIQTALANCVGEVEFRAYVDQCVRESRLGGGLESGRVSEMVHHRKEVEEDLVGSRDGEDPMDADDRDILRRAAEGDGVENEAAEQLVDILMVPDTNATTACQVEEKIAEKAGEKDETEKN